MRDVKKDMERMEKLDHDIRVAINTNAMHLSNIVREMDVYVERLASCTVGLQYNLTKLIC